MQVLVYVFIALAALGVAAAAYFGLTFSPIEALVTALAFGSVAVTLMERQLRQRAETRLERAVEDLARLLSTDAKAGQVLSQRVNAIADTNVGSRLEGIEADISVLGTVVRQVAEAVADIEETRRFAPGQGASAPSEASLDEDSLPEPLISEAALRAAMDADRMIFHIEPVVVLPQRRPLGYDLVPRLMQDEGELADAADFMPQRGAEDLVRRIEAMALDEAVVIARRARTAGMPIRLFLPLSRATILDKRALNQLVATLSANQAITPSFGFAIAYDQFRTFSPLEKQELFEVRKTGAHFLLADADQLRFDFAELQGLGFTSVRLDATRFIRQPNSFTDLHAADVAHYAKRFEIELCATGVIDEQQVLTLFEDGITEAQGPHIGRPGPVRPDLVVERTAQSRQHSAGVSIPA